MNNKNESNSNLQNSDSQYCIDARERGAVLVFFAIVLPVLLLFVGLAIDVSRASITREQAREFTRLLSLSAVQAYFESSETASGQDLDMAGRLDVVREKIRAEASNNESMGFWLGSIEPIKFAGEAGADAAGGIITPGRYFFSTVPLTYCPDAACQGSAQCTAQGGCNPCASLGATSNPPCFLPMNYTEVTGGNIPVSAFRVESRPLEGIRARFAKVFMGEIDFPILAHSIAAAIPRRIMFLVDVSGNLVRETYLRRRLNDQEEEPELGRGAQYSFRLSRDNAEVCQESEFSDDMQWRFLEQYDPATGNYPSTEVCYIPTTPPGLSRSTDLMGQDDTGLHLLDSPQVHFWDDYSIQNIQASPENVSASLSDAARAIFNPARHPSPDGCTGAPDENPRYCAEPGTYRVDTLFEEPVCQSGSGPLACAGPEPLRTVIFGLRKSVELFQDRLVAGDKMGFVFFDFQPSWNRIVNPTDDFAYLDNLTQDNATGFELRRALHLFPSSKSRTNMQSALGEAITQLARDRDLIGGVPTQDSIVLISDGLTNCHSCGGRSAEEIARLDLDRDGVISVGDLGFMVGCWCQCPSHPSGGSEAIEVCVPPAGASQCGGRCFDLDDLSQYVGLWGCDGGCQNNYPSYLAAIRSVLNFARSQSAGGLGIPFHVIALGRHVGVNTIDVLDPTAPIGEPRCLSDTEARAQSLPFVRGGAESGPSDCGAQATTQEEACAEAFSRASPQFPFYESVRNLYYLARSTGGIFAPLFLEQADWCGDTPNLCTAQPDDPSCCTPGRVNVTDKFCRSPTEQMQDYVKEIVNDSSPFVIVESS